MGLKIKRKHLERIKAHGEGSFPDECCGFLLGRQEKGHKEIVSLFPARNAREDQERYHRFLITPQDYLLSERRARARGLEVIGFYHSHPNAAARPSGYDLEHAWPWYSYIIVSVKENQADDVTSWTLQDDRARFNREELVIVLEAGR